MIKKKVEKKELTVEEKLATEKKRELSFIEDSIGNLNEPTYLFHVGDEVRFGALKKCVVDEVLFNGKAYGLRCIATENNYGNPYDYETYRVAAWVDVRGTESGDTDFSRNQDVRIYFNNSSIESLLHYYYHQGIDTVPDYQRDYVWEQSDKELLIDSIFNNIDIGKFVLIHLDYDEYIKRGKSYEILDGKQRLNAIVDFYENRFAYKGKYYNELSGNDRRVFKKHKISVGEVKETDKKTVLKYFLMLNRTGKAMDEAHLKAVEDMLNGME